MSTGERRDENGWWIDERSSKEIAGDLLALAGPETDPDAVVLVGNPSNVIGKAPEPFARPVPMTAAFRPPEHGYCVPHAVDTGDAVAAVGERGNVGLCAACIEAHDRRAAEREERT